MSGNSPLNDDPSNSKDHQNHPDDLSRMLDYLGSSQTDYGSLPGMTGEGEQSAPDIPKSPNNVRHDRFDQRLYGELYEACEQVRNLEQNEGAFETFPELLSDFFYSFYKAAPSLADEESVEEAPGRANRPFVERLLEDEETARTRINTRLDDMSAALAALAAGEKILEEIADRPELSEFVNPEKPQSPEEPEDQEDPEDPEDTGAGESGGDQEAEEDAGTGQNQQSNQNLSNQPSPRDLRRAIRAAAEAGAEEAEGTQEAMDGWGISPADLAQVPLGERIELARSLRNPRFKHLFDLVGRMRNLAYARARESLKSRTNEIHSVELSGDLARMLPAELAAGLATPSRARRLDFYRRFVEGEILSYELTANEPQAKGPIVAAIDCSDSMGFSGGANMQWATAVALALVDLACSGANAADKRAAALVFFNESVKKVVRFAPGERDPRKFLEVARTGPSGGTRYEPAWKQMFTLCEESAHQGADMLFVTDGICRVSEEFAAWIRDEKSRIGASAYSVLLGSTDSLSSSGARELERYSDEVWTARDLTSGADDLAADIFGRLS